MGIAKGKKPAPKKGRDSKAVPKKGVVREVRPKKNGPRKTVNRTARPKTARPPFPREKLIAVRPSGSKENSFFDLVHEVARQIPKGRVTSYGAIGAALGTRGSARMVGWAMMAVPYEIGRAHV